MTISCLNLSILFQMFLFASFICVDLTHHCQKLFSVKPLGSYRLQTHRRTHRNKSEFRQYGTKWHR